MASIINGSSPTVTFSDGTTQSTAGFPSTGGTISGNLAVTGQTSLGTGQTDYITAIGGGGTGRVEVVGGNTDINMALSTKGAGAFYIWRGGYGGTNTLLIDGSSNLQFNSGYGSVATAYGCRAWVNFNGTGTIAIRGSGNVSSISDLGAGEYQVNYSTALVDTNYASLAVAGGQEGGVTEIPRRSTTPTTSAVRMIYNNGNSDSLYMSVSIFR